MKNEMILENLNMNFLEKEESQKISGGILIGLGGVLLGIYSELNQAFGDIVRGYEYCKCKQ